MKVMTQANTVLTISNYAVMAQLAQMNETMSAIQAYLKTLSSAATTKPKREYLCWICGINLSHGRKEFTNKKSGHKFKKIIGRNKKGLELG